MRLVQIEWKPSDRQLRQFGLACCAAMMLGTWVATRDAGATGMAAGAGVGVALTGWISPQSLRVPFLGLSLAAFPMGLFVSELLLLAIWWLVMWPIGLCFRVLGRDALTRRFEPDRASYWTPKAQAKSPRRYFHPF